MLGYKRFIQRAVSCALFVGTLVCAPAAWAVPAYDKLKDGNYGTVSALLVSSGGGRYTYLFTVTDTSSSPIKGVLVYGPDDPIGMSQPANTSTQIQAGHGYAFWDMNGPTGHYLQPGQQAPTNRPDLVFTLTYNHPIDVSQLCYAFHVVGSAKNDPGAYFRANSLVCGQVVCQESDGTTMGIPNATVSLVNANNLSQVYATTTADANGNFTLTPPGPGDYEVCATAANWGTSYSTPFHFVSNGCDLCVNVVLSALPIATRASNDIYGIAYFTDTPRYQQWASTTVITNEDGSFTQLLNPANVFELNGNHTYPFVGYIPHHEELGHFGGTNEPKVWVELVQPLQSETGYTGHSFVNLIGVQDGIGQAADHTQAPFTLTYVSMLPFDGPGTAFNVNTTNVNVIFHTSNPIQPNAAATLTDLPVALSNGNNLPSSLPPAHVLPPGYMNRSLVRMRVPYAMSWTAFVTTTFQNVCGNNSTVTVDPVVPGPQ